MCFGQKHSSDDDDDALILQKSGLFLFASKIVNSSLSVFIHPSTQPLNHPLNQCCKYVMGTLGLVVMESFCRHRSMCPAWVGVQHSTKTPRGSGGCVGLFFVCGIQKVGSMPKCNIDPTRAYTVVSHMHACIHSLCTFYFLLICNETTTHADAATVVVVVSPLSHTVLFLVLFFALSSFH